MNCRSEEKSKVDRALIVLLSLVFLYLIIYILPTNIHGDGKFHTLYAREIVETGELPRHQPYEIMSVDDGNKVMMPIPYPLTTHVLIAFFYMLGGENAVKFFSPVLGMLTAAFIYLLLKSISRPAAFAAASLAIVLNSERFIMVPLMEQLLLFGMAATLYFYFRWLAGYEKKYVILTGLFLGLVLATKQQGLLFFGVILLHALCVGLFRTARPGKAAIMKQFSAVMAIAVIIGACPLADQIDRNGTWDAVPGDSSIPFMKSKYPLDQQAYQELESIIEYRPDYNSVAETFATYLLTPFAYQRSVRFVHAVHFEAFVWPLLILSLVLCLLLYAAGFAYLWRNNRLLLSLLVPLLLEEVIVSYQTNTHPYQYHNIGIAIMGMFLVFGLLRISGGQGRLAFRRNMKRVVVSAVVVVAITGYVFCVGGTLWGDSGRYDARHVKAYQQMGDFVRSNTDKGAVFLTGGGTATAFEYYSRREIMWISEGGGVGVPIIFRTEDRDEALFWLRQYNIGYIFIDYREMLHSGSSDYIPRHGLLDYIDDSPDLFVKVRSVDPGDGRLLVLYEVLGSVTQSSSP